MRPMHLKKVGRIYQAVIQNDRDLEAVLELDEGLWVATSAPRSAIRCDPCFLDFLDKNGNGRINTGELKAAIGWLLEMLSDRSRLGEDSDVLSLPAIRVDRPEGKELTDSARFVLDTLGESEQERISLEQVRRFTANILSRPLNGDGVIVPEASDDPHISGFIEDVRACMGGTRDAGGKQGITGEQVSRFLGAARDYLAWKERGEMPPDQTRTEVLPLGSDTPRIYEIYHAHAARVNEFFGLCNAVRFLPELAGPRHWPGGESKAPQPVNLVEAPLARPGADCVLPLSNEAVNPAYRRWLGALQEEVLPPILGERPEAVSEADWNRVTSALAPYEAYLKEKEGAQVEPLSGDQLRAYLEGDFEQEVGRLIQEDQAVAVVRRGVRELERLLLYHRHLLRLVNNFVSFPELYATDRRALFEMGSAVIDGRWFDFAVKVDDVSAHSATAKSSNILILYLEVTGAAGDSPFLVAVPATSGTRGNLNPGKRGVFFDTAGKEYDARVIQIIENPISLWEAIAAPFKGLWRFLVGKIETWSTRAEKTLEEGVEKALATTKTTTAAPAKQGTPGGAAGIIAWLSVSVAALSSAWAFVVKQLSEVEAGRLWWGIGAVILTVLVVVIVPVGIVAVLRLRRQDLSSLLEGCGWAINARMRLNRQQRKHFTRRPRRP